VGATTKVAAEGAPHPNNATCEQCGGAHRLWHCANFKKCLKDRRDFVYAKKLCFLCLLPNHLCRSCESNIRCKLCGNKSHNSLLHYETEQKSRPDSLSTPADNDLKTKSPVTLSEEKTVVGCNVCKKPARGTKLHKVLPVKVWLTNPADFILTYCLLDDGSEISVCTSSFARRLGAKLTAAKNVQMCTDNGVSEVRHLLPEMHIQGVGEPDIFQVKGTLVLDSIVDVTASIPTTGLANSYPHLQDLTFPYLGENRVELLIGQNVQNAFRVSDWRCGDDNAPFAYHTALGWALWGIDHCNEKETETTMVCVNFLRTSKLHEPANDSCETVPNILSQDFRDVDVPQLPSMSREDRKALAIMEGSIKKVNRHYQIALPWRDDNPNLPQNRLMAEKRLHGVQRKLLTDSDLREKYCGKIGEYIANGYASPVPQNAFMMPGTTFYVPHFSTSVLTKFRVVFDCTAKFDGLSN